MADNKINKAKAILELLKHETITATMLRDGILLMVELVKKAQKDSVTKVTTENEKILKEALALLEKKNAEFVKNTDEEVNVKVDNFTKKAQKTLDKALEALGKINAIEVHDGEPGAPGKDADEEAIIQEVLKRFREQAPQIKPDTALEIAAKINTLDKEIDAKAIKNLPQFTREIVHEVGRGFIETPIKAGANITVTKDAGGSWVIASTASGGGAVDSVNSKTGVVVLSTLDISENTNLYYTDERAQDAIGNNLGTGLAYNDGTGAISLSYLGIESLVDPNANKLMAWDDTDGAIKFIVIGANLSYDHATRTLSATAGSGGLSDSDYGDITVSGTGTVMTIDNDVVTYAKMQNVSATSRILGRITAAAGDVEELTAANVKTILALAQADITGLTTADSPQFTAINLGHASDTTITRVSAGLIAVEGITLVDLSTAQGLTNKTLTTPILTGLPTGSGVSAAATASTLASRDANANITANNHIEGFRTTATAGGTTTLVVGDTYTQVFTGVTTQICKLPVATTLVNGQSFLIINNSTGVVTVQTSGANVVQAMVASSSIVVTCVDTAGGTGLASWTWQYVPSMLSTNTASTLVLRDASGNFAAGTITAALTGTASGNLVSGGALGTPSSGTGTNITGIPAANILAGSFGAGAYVISTSLQVATLELGAATDTTLSRVSAGVIAVEGITIADISSAQEFTTKTLNASIAKGTWTASGTWTLPAHTLGGTISGGGNNINNVIIGATTPLAGSFTLLTASKAGLALDVTNSTDAVSNQVAKFSGTNATRANNDLIYQSFFLANSTGVQKEFGRFQIKAPVATNTTEDGSMIWAVMNAGTLTDTMTLTKNSLSIGTAGALTVGTIELGAASDTTIARVSAGVISVEGVNVVMTGGALGTPSSGTLTNCTFPTLNQNTSGSAASLSISGQTGLLSFTGLASTGRIKTVRDAADTILELGGSYTPSGTWTNMPLTTPAITGLATGSGVAATATASTLMSRDANKNTAINNLVEGFTTTATAAGITTMAIGDTYTQIWTGSSTQTIKLPTTSVLQGQQYFFINQSTGAITIQSSGANAIIILAANTSALLTAVVATPTTAANWAAQYYGDVITTGKALTISKTMSFTAADDTGVYTLPTGTATLVATNVATLSSLTTIGTITSGGLGTGAVIGGVTMTLGSDASGDVYYRNSSGVLTRVAAGAQGTIFSMGASSVPAWGAVPYAPSTCFSSAFETAARWTSLAVSGTNTFGATGLAIATTVTTTRCAGVSIDTGSAGMNPFFGSPTFECVFNMVTAPGNVTSGFFGVGSVPVNGSGHTFTAKHFGFKLVSTGGGVMSLYATQGDGTTENASAALTTVAADSMVYVAVKKNSTTSADYYWKINGGNWSSATNLTSNLPSGAVSTMIQMTVSNNAAAVNLAVNLTGVKYCSY